MMENYLLSTSFHDVSQNAPVTCHSFQDYLDESLDDDVPFPVSAFTTHDEDDHQNQHHENHLHDANDINHNHLLEEKDNGSAGSGDTSADDENSGSHGIRSYESSVIENFGPSLEQQDMG